jgi:hypothetical protein
MNPEINFLLYRLKDDSRVHCELNIEGSKVYSIIVNPEAKIKNYQVNFKNVESLPVTVKTKKLLQFFNEQMAIIKWLLNEANKEVQNKETFNNLWWLLKDATQEEL